MTQNNIEEAVRKLRAAKDEKARLEDALTEQNKAITHLEQQVLPALMEAQGISAFKVAGIGSVSLRDEVYPSVLAENREELHQWLRSAGYEDLVTEQVHPSTLKSWVKERLEASDEIPDAVKVTIVKKANLRKA